MEAHFEYFWIIWCVLLLLVIFLAVNCLHRNRQYLLQSDPDKHPLIESDSNQKYASVVSKARSTTHVSIKDTNINTTVSDMSPGSSNHEESIEKNSNTGLTLKEVLGKTWIARSKWENIGIQLGLENEIDAIRCNHHNNTEDCYREMLTIWIRNKTATWKKLADALSHQSVGFCHLANSILHVGVTEIQAEYTVRENDMAILERSDEGFRCPYCGNCSLETFLKRKCPKLDTVSDLSCFPYLNSKHLTDAEMYKLRDQLQEQAADIITSFTDLVLHMKGSFKSRNIDPQDVVSAALLISRRESSTRQMSLFNQDINSINKLIIYLAENNYMSFFNYHIVKYIIAKFGNEADKGALDDYETKFKKFCQRSIFEIPQDILGPIPKDEEKLAFKITQELLDHLPSRYTSSCSPVSVDDSLMFNLSLKDVAIIRDKVAKALHLENAWRLTFLGASKGCIELTFSATEDIIDTFKSQLSVPTKCNRGSNACLADLEKIGIRLLCGPPGKPHISETTDTSVSLQWSKPKYQGYYPIQYYLVHWHFVSNPTTKYTLHTEGDTQSVKITHLPQNEMLTFTVQVVTNIGHGIESKESAPVTLSSACPSGGFVRPRAYSTTDMSNPLTIESLDELVLKLRRATSKWYEIGFKLGVDVEILNKIKNKQRNVPKWNISKSCLKDMLKYWLNKGNASKRLLSEALNDHGICLL